MSRFVDASIFFSFVFATLVTVTGCNSSGPTPAPEQPGPSTPITLVDGDFKSSATEVVVYKQFADLISGCMPNGIPVEDSYFESENFVVFTDVLDEKNMRLVASIAEESLVYVSDVLDLTPDEIFDYRVNIGDKILYLAAQTPTGDGNSALGVLVGDEHLPVDFGSWSEKARKRFFFSYWRGLTNEGRNEFANGLQSYAVNYDISKYDVPRKIQICISSPNSVATTDTQGIQTKSPSNLKDHLKTNHYQGYRHIFQHEMVHMVSMIITGLFYGGSATDQWYEEGVAEYLTGGHTSNNPEGFNPLLYAKTPNYGPGEIGFDNTEQYAVFTSAVEYLFSSVGNRLGAGIPAILDVWLAIRNSSIRTGFFADESSFARTPNGYIQYNRLVFMEAFDATFKRLDGSQFTYKNYESEYTSIHQSL